MQKNKKLIVACALAAVTTFGLGATLQQSPVVMAETDKDAILYYDFSANTIGENVNGYSTVQNLGTKANANATIYNGTGLSVNEQLSFDQFGHNSADEGINKAHFELPTGALNGLTSFTLQMDVTDYTRIESDKEYFFAATANQIAKGAEYGASNQGFAFAANAWNGSKDTLYYEGWTSQWNWGSGYGEDVYFIGNDGVFSIVSNGSTLSFYLNTTLIYSHSIVDSTYFSTLNYIRVGGYIHSSLGCLSADIDNVKLYDYARTTAQLTEDKTAFNARINEGKKAKVYYDFAKADANGVVENLGTGVNMDGRIVETKDDVKIENRSLVIKNSKEANAENGYFRLPDNLFQGTKNWSIEMNVEYLEISDMETSFLFFGSKDPITNNADHYNNLQLFWNWNGSVGSSGAWVPTHQAIGAGANNLWTVSNSGSITQTKDEEKTVALVYEDHITKVYYNGTLVLETPKTEIGCYYTGMSFNKIGGYIYNWGRSATNIKIGSFAFYDYARTETEISGYSNYVERTVASLTDDATTITPYYSYMISGGYTGRTIVFPDNIDLKTVGVKEYIIWRAGQDTPIRFTLTTQHVDSDKDNECDGCGAIIDGIGKAYGINLGLNGTISVNIFMGLTDETIADEGAYMKTEYNGKTIKTPVSAAEVRSEDGKEYYVFSVEVPAKDIDSDIASSMVRSNGKVGKTYTYSVKTYAEKMMEKEPTTATLMTQLLNYGTYAKAFFAGEDVVATEAMNAVTEETLAGFAPRVEGKLPEGINVLGASLILESETTIRLYFTAGSAIDGYTFKTAGKTMNAIVADAYCYLEVTDICAKDLDSAYVFEISNGTDAFTLTYSALSYAKATFAAEDAKLVKLAQALYLYNQAANSYFEN